MSEESREHLSCLMDGETGRDTSRFLVRRLGADAELSATWARYHLVRDCLRHHEGSLVSSSLSVRVRQAIDNEAAPRRSAPRVPAWLKPAAGLAVAASVALVAVLAVGPGGQAVSPAGESAAPGVADSFTSPQALTPPPISQQASLAGQQSGNSRMNAYLLRHYQATGSTGGKGFVTFVPIVVRASTAQTLRENEQDGAAREVEPGEAAER